ncbi:BQ2448_2543 [Microbotryum intermedium]|uniref:BQ2448_2543 protein n=1 Tax=Microbotryum intermedium TaxID=269621 RepID=A0A238FBZ5_9BASI|nr:BQ2448_2543 [Microbotryum intermedium]
MASTSDTVAPPSSGARCDPDRIRGARPPSSPVVDQAQQEQPSLHRSSRWEQLVSLDAHIAQLEQTSPAASSLPSFSLIILDPIHVTQHRDGAEVGACLADALDKLTIDSLTALTTSATGASNECLATWISHVEDLRTDDRIKLEDSIHGFQEQSLLGVGIVLRSASAVERKVKALIEFHGRSPLCSSIILGEHFRPIGSSFSSDPTVFNKLYYVTESDLANLSTAVSSTGSASRQSALADPDAASPRRRPQLARSRFSSSPSGRIVGVKLDESFSDPLPLAPGDSRHLEPLVAIWRQTLIGVRPNPICWAIKPPPCHNFYLSPSGCPHGTSCKFGHDYILSGRDFADLRSSVQRMPCDSVKEGSTKPCSFGDECLYGHVCPYDDKCAWNRCKFGSIAHPRKNASRRNSGNEGVNSPPRPSSTSGAAPLTLAPSPSTPTGGRQPAPSSHAGMEGWSRKRRESVSK